MSTKDAPNEAPNDGWDRLRTLPGGASVRAHTDSEGIGRVISVSTKDATNSAQAMARTACELCRQKTPQTKSRTMAGTACGLYRAVSA